MQKMNVESTTTVSLGGAVAVITDTSKTWNFHTAGSTEK